jgi:hypothetical protein
MEMAMSNRCARILAAGGAAVLAVTLGVAAALAAGTWTIQPGGGIQATASERVVTLRDTTTSSPIYCTSTATGTLRSGSGLPGFRVGSLSAVSFHPCTYSSSLVAFVRAGGLPWHVNLSSYNAATGVARGTLSHVHLTTSGSGCTAMIDGTSGTADNGQVAFRYTGSTGQLTLLATGGDLHFYDVSTGCLGYFNSGDPAALSATYTLTPKQAISSP